MIRPSIARRLEIVLVQIMMMIRSLAPSCWRRQPARELCCALTWSSSSSTTRPARRPSACAPRSFSTSAAVDEQQQQSQSEKESSKSAEFKQMTPHPSILKYVQKIGVGIPRRRSSGKAVKSEQVLAKRPGQYMAPPPFGPGGKPVRVVGSVGIVEQTRSSGIVHHKFPSNNSLTPEIAVAGRSNVGKSTLLNALLYGNRNEDVIKRIRQRGKVPSNMKLPKGKKAIMSSKPGETREITFYMLQHVKLEAEEVESRMLTLVDLPGYGFAYAREEHRQEFQNLMADYLLNRGKPLKRVLLLLDARHGLKKPDLEFIEMLQTEVEQRVQRVKEETRVTKERVRLPQLPPIQLVLTKCDLVTQANLARRVAQVRQELSDSLRREPSQLPILLVSSRAGVGYNNVDRRTNLSRGGILELQRELASLIVPRRSPRTRRGNSSPGVVATSAPGGKVPSQSPPRIRRGTSSPGVAAAGAPNQSRIAPRRSPARKRPGNSSTGGATRARSRRSVSNF